MSDIAPYAEPGPSEKGRGNGCVIGLLAAVVVLALVSVGACVFLVVAIDDDDDGGSDAERSDVAEPTCQVDDQGNVEAVMQVTNPTSERSNYVIQVTFDDAEGTAIDTRTLTVDGLAPNQQAIARAETDTPAPADGAFTCRVTDVVRFSDE